MSPITALTKREGDRLSVETRDFPLTAFEALRQWFGPLGPPDALILHPGRGRQELVLVRWESFARIAHLTKGN